MQYNISNIQKTAEIHKNEELKLSETISLKVFLVENLTELMLSKACFENEKSFKSYEVHILEHNEFYHITRKYYMIDIKIIACRYWELDLQDFVMCDDKFKIFPCDFKIYDEIFALNLEKNYIRPHCQFFQLNPNVNVITL